MLVNLKEVEQVEIITLQDNYIDFLVRDDTDVIKRAKAVKGMEIRGSILAEHGFSAVISIKHHEGNNNVLFDFGFSEHGAAYNAEVLDIDLKKIDYCVVSHGHKDHIGGFEQVIKKINKKDIPLLIHPAAFRKPRYIKVSDDVKIDFPTFDREQIKKLDVLLQEERGHKLFLDDNILFLGEIPRKTKFEKGKLPLYYLEKEKEKHDDIEDDTSVVINVKNKGLIVLTGCAHAGIVNTVRYAMEITGINKIYALMGGFHLSGVDYESIIKPTLNSLKEINPEYIIPTHCTGLSSILEIKRQLPESFIFNMSGTKLVFSSLK